MKDLEAKFHPDGKHHKRIKNSLSPLVVEICNSQTPHLATFELVSMYLSLNALRGSELTLFPERLKMAGYEIYLLSNIGVEFFEDLQEKLPGHLFEPFDGFYTANEADQYVNKPDKRIFHQ